MRTYFSIRDSIMAEDEFSKEAPLVQKEDVYIYIRLDIPEHYIPPKAYYSWTEEEREAWKEACVEAMASTIGLEQFCKKRLTEIAQEFRQFEQTFLEKKDPEELKRTRQRELIPCQKRTKTK